MQPARRRRKWPIIAGIVGALMVLGFIGSLISPEPEPTTKAAEPKKSSATTSSTMPSTSPKPSTTTKPIPTVTKPEWTFLHIGAECTREVGFAGRMDAQGAKFNADNTEFTGSLAKDLATSRYTACVGRMLGDDARQNGVDLRAGDLGGDGKWSWKHGTSKVTVTSTDAGADGINIVATVR